MFEIIPLRLLIPILAVISTTHALEATNRSPYNQFSANDIDSDIISHPKPTPKSHQPQPQEYQPTWESLDARPLPTWYDKAKVGVFLHWGVFSVPSFQSEWFWYYFATKDKTSLEFMRQNYPPRFTYQDFARDFTAEFFDPNRWADIFKKSGAKYLVFSSKHHEGYTLWPSKYSFGWNVGDVGPNRDLLGDLAKAVRNQTDIRFGVYHSWFEWYNPLYLEDKGNNYSTWRFVRQKAMPELKELVVKYEPEVIWSDGEWEAPDVYWRSKEFLAWLYNSSPVKDTVVVNDRWGNGTSCKHGGFFSCQDHYNPGHILPFKWENAMTVDKASWGFRRNAALTDFRTPDELIFELVSTISCGGNFLINVGPTKDGMIAPILEERLTQLGTWLEINGQAIYESVPWTAQNDSYTKGVWYTQKPEEKKIFAILLETNWPKMDKDGQTYLNLCSVDAEKLRIGNIQMLGIDPGVILPWRPAKVHPMIEGCKNDCGIVVTLPNIPPGSKNKFAWTLVINLA